MTRARPLARPRCPAPPAGLMSDDDEARRLARALGQACLDRGLQVACAESCTGGGLAERITRIPGSSAWFECGIVAYQNRAKQSLLGVPEALLRQHGAVSEPVAQAMAEGLLAQSPAALAVAVTGIAGPSGGSAEKPCGTVCLAWLARHAPDAASTTTAHFPGDRQTVREQTCLLALHGLLDLLSRHPTPNNAQ